jgi:TatD DNase family protein
MDLPINQNTIKQHKLIDTHTHLYLSEFDVDQDDVMKRALSICSHLLLPNIDLGSIPNMLRLVNFYPNQCYAMMGLHPCSVTEDYQTILSYMEAMIQENPNTYIGVGETGLDLYWDKSSLALQIEALKIQIEWAKSLQIPIVLHTRDAFSETIALIENAQDGRLSGVFHCFSGSIEDAKRAEGVGFYLGIGGVFTYKKSNLKNIIPQINSTQIVLETDSPYLTPVPHRGKRNESAYLVYIANELANTLNISYNDLTLLTNRNTFRLFNKIYKI